MKFLYFCSTVKKSGNILVILLCGLFLYNSMGYMLVFSAMKANLKKQVFAGISRLPERTLVTVRLPLSEQSRLIKGKKYPELRIDGKMYDVVKTVISGNETICYCARDIKEELLSGRINLLSTRNSNENPSRKTTSLILDNVIKIALIFNIDRVYQPSSMTRYFATDLPDYTSPYLKNPAPPPQNLA